MEELDIFKRMNAIAVHPAYALENASAEHLQKVLDHRAWLQQIRRERPNTTHHYRIGVYIRYFNQTKYENYLDYHIKQFEETLALCPNWELIGFYIDEGGSAPNMESAPEWCRLLEDCENGKIDLILTQKISNVAKKPFEITLCARILASLTPPVGIYFISEDLYTLASYYTHDTRDTYFLPDAVQHGIENTNTEIPYD